MQQAPIVADYNGDRLDDRVVKCGTEWRIGLTGVGAAELRIVDLDDDILSLPPIIYPGGIKYQDIKAILEHYGLFSKYQNKDPFTPYTVQCIKYWAPPPTYCLAK